MRMEKYNNFSEMLMALISGGEKGFTADNFSGAPLGDLAARQAEFCEKFSELMHTEGQVNVEPEGWLHHWYIRKKDIDENRKSVMGYISRKADRNFKPADFMSSPHWNYSVKQLIDNYKRIIGEDEDGGRIWWIPEDQGGGEE